MNSKTAESSRPNVARSRLRRRYAARLASALLSLSLCALAVSARAADDDVTLVSARERFKEGVSYFDQKQYDKARAAFLQAYALRKHPAVLLNLAQSELRSGHEADAAQHFSEYLRENPEATDAERQSAQTGLQAAKPFVTELEVTVDLSESDVYLDGAPVGRSPLPGPLYLTSGSHELNVRRGSRSSKKRVEASAGAVLSTTFTLGSPGAQAAADVPGPVETEAQAEAEAEASGPGRKAFFPWLAESPPALVGAGVTGLGLVGGVIFALRSKSNYDSADKIAAQIESTALKDGKATGSGACVNPAQWLAATDSIYGRDSAQRATRANEYDSNCDSYSSRVDSGDKLKTLSTVSFVVAGVAAVGTVVYYFVSPSAKEQSARTTKLRLAVTPVRTHDFSGALVSGSF